MRLLRRREGAAVATYAAVLDGVHLWLDVDGPVGVREVGGKDVVDLGEAPHDLSGLTGREYDVLADRAPIELAEPLMPRTVPLAPDGMTRWEILSVDGQLRLVRRTAQPTAELDAVDLRGGRLHLRLRPPAGVEPGCHLLLLDTDDRLVETLPATAHDGLVETLIGLDDLPAGYFGVLRLALGDERAWVRIRRRVNDLADPNHAVLLPELYAPDAEHPRARLRWNPDGLLALRSLGPDEHR